MESQIGGSELWEGMVGRMGCNFKLGGQGRLKLTKLNSTSCSSSLPLARPS